MALVTLAVWSIGERVRSICGRLAHSMAMLLDRRGEAAVDDLLSLTSACSGVEADARILYLALGVLAVGMALVSTIQRGSESRSARLTASAFTIVVLLVVALYPVIVIQ
jgi:hypothetical protein